MSTSDLYRVYRTKAVHMTEFRNGWGTAPLLWDYLAKQFIGPDFQWVCQREGDRRLWDLYRDGRVPRSLRLVHAFTMDHIICPPDQVAEFADACDEVGRVCARDSHVNHWAAIATTMRQAKAKPRQLGYGLACTSVSDIWCGWRGEPAPSTVFELAKDTP